ncbi:MAG TPA: hypothetical protein VGJ92_00675 [Methanocella sp.]|jgi:hypothetical protein
MIEDLKTSNMTVVQFLDELRDNKGHTSIIFSPGEDDLVNRNFMFFYDGDLLEYQVGTKRLVKAIVDGDRFAIRKDGKEYRGEKARALFKNDKEFKLWKRTIDDEQNAIIEDAVATIHAYQLSPTCAWKELQMPKEYTFGTVRELMAYVLSFEFEAALARYMHLKQA